MQSEENEMPTALQEIRPTAVQKLTAQDIRADINLIQTILKGVMKEGVHYGVVPGTGNKPSLLKPGAEKIMVTFRLAAKPLIEDLSNADEIRYRISLTFTHQTTGLTVGYGVGECSSNETKYKWIGTKFPTEFDETPDDRRRTVWKQGKEKPYQVKQVRANISDVANTVLKMAKKRALVDGVLTCTAASDIFTQDIEDLPPEIAQAVVDAETPKAPKRKEAPALAAATPPPAAPPTTPPPVTTPATPKQETQPSPMQVVDPADDYYQEEEEQSAPVARPKIDFSKARNITAKFDAKCKLCDQSIGKDTRMVYIPEGTHKGGYHVDCAKA